MNDPRQQNNPLDADALARLRRDRAVCNEAYQEIERARQCGLSMPGEQALCDALASRIDALLVHYGGERKSR